MEEIKRLQKHLYLIRSCAGWTAETLGKKLGVSRQTISSFEKEGNELSIIQYLAIRKLFEDEIAASPDDTEMLSQVIEMLVDHPDNYTPEERSAVISNAMLMAPSILKKPSERRTISVAWKAILAASGVVVSLALIAFLAKKDS